MSETVLAVERLTTGFDVEGRFVPAVIDVSFQLHKGETLCLVGESGSGKSLTAFSILRLVQPPGRISHGAIVYQGRDLCQLSEREMQTRARRRNRADLSGADDGAQPGLHHRQSDRRNAARARPRNAADRARQGHRAARSGARPGSVAPRARIPASAVGRLASAGADRAVARVQSGSAHCGRADDRARRHHPGANPRAAARPAAAARPLAAAHHARPRRRRRDGGSGGRDVRRTDRRRSAGRGPVRCACAPLHARLARVDSRRRARHATDGHLRNGANPRLAPAGMLFYAALPVAVRAVPDRTSRHHRLRRRANGEVLPARAGRGTRGIAGVTDPGAGAHKDLGATSRAVHSRPRGQSGAARRA